MNAPATATTEATTPQVCVSLLQLAKVAGQRLAGALSDAGLSGPALALLDRIERGGSLSQLDLARAVGVHPSNVVRALDQLEAAGLLIRTRDPEDRRRQTVALTPAGAKKLTAARARVKAVEAELLDELSADERSQLQSLLSRVGTSCTRC